jgi:hypothetical protein
MIANRKSRIDPAAPDGEQAVGLVERLDRVGNSASTVRRRHGAMSATSGAVASRCRSKAIASSERLTAGSLSG